MPEAIIRFSKCLQGSQEYGTDDEHMVSLIFFSLEADGATYPDLFCDVKQSVGAEFENAPLEVSRPKGYDGSLDYAPFRQAVEEYYRSLVGSSGRAIGIGGGSGKMRGNVIVVPHEARVHYSEASMAW